MATLWKKFDTGFFGLELPAEWVTDEPRAGTLLAQDERGELAVTIVAITRQSQNSQHDSPIPAQGVPVSAPAELRKWVESQRHVKVRQAARWIGSAPQPTATVEGVETVRRNVAWWKRVLRRAPRKIWRFWTIVHPQMVLLVSCSGRAEVVERGRAVVDRMVLSVRLPGRDLLLGRHFTETVVSLARSYFPQMAVAVIDDVHLQFGSRNVSLVRLHRRYLASPENLPTHVKAFFAEVQGELPAAEATGSWSRARTHILPTLMTPSMLESAPGNLLQEEWINGLTVAYVLEDGGTDHPVTVADARRWKVTQEALHEQALLNLVAHSHEQTMEGHRAEGYTMLVLATPDRHNAARILLPELHRKLREHLGPTFYAALPTREFLLAFSTGKEEVLAQVRQQIGADYSRAREGLSNKLFLVTPDGIAGDPGEREEWEW